MTSLASLRNKIKNIKSAVTFLQNTLVDTCCAYVRAVLLPTSIHFWVYVDGIIDHNVYVNVARS